MQSFDRLKEAYSKGIWTLLIVGRVRSVCIRLSQESRQSVDGASSLESYALLRPKIFLMTVYGNLDELKTCLREEPVRTGRTAGQNSPQTSLEWHQNFFNDSPLMKCLDSMEDEDLADRVYERLLEESRPVVGQGLRA